MDNKELKELIKELKELKELLDPPYPNRTDDDINSCNNQIDNLIKRIRNREQRKSHREK